MILPLARMVIILSVSLAIPSSAQSAAPVDVIAGRVTDADGRPVPMARVRARADDASLAAMTESDSVGRFVLRVRGGTGRYLLSANRLGFAPALAVVQRGAAGERIEHDFRLAPAAIALEPVRVRERQSDAPLPRRSAGDRSAALPSIVSEKLPFDPSDLAAIAATRPGVLNVGGDSSGLGLSIGGQPTSQTSTTLDGATYGGAALPQEAIRSTNVITSTYDVSRGQFTGGQVDVTTRGGTGVWAGAANGTFRSRKLQFGAAPSAGSGQAYDLAAVNGGGGGPLLADKLFVYGAAQGSLRVSPTSYLDANDAGLLARLKVSRDSVERFYDVLGRVGATAGATPTAARFGNGSALLRFDLHPAEGQSLMTRLDWRGMDAVRIATSPWAPPPSGGTLRSSDAGVMTELTSRREPFVNRLRGYATRGLRSGAPSLAEPLGLVQIVSRADDGSASLSTLSFGGNSQLSQRNATSLLELSDEIAAPLWDGAHRVKAGVLYSVESASLEAAPNGYGTFTFGSLRDLEDGSASSFTRALGAAARRATSYYRAAYAGDEWQASPALRLLYGARIDYGRYQRGGDAAPVVDSVLHLRVGDAPAELVVSPRLGFSYEIPTKLGGEAGFLLRGGTGRFRGRMPVGALASALNETGTPGSQQLLECVGAATPRPDWVAYLADPSRIQSTCSGGAPAFAARAPVMTGFGDGFGAPRVWHSSLETSIQLPHLYSVEAGLTVIDGERQPLALDRNLRTDAGFALADEGDRPVYLPLGAVDRATGGVSPSASRLAPALGAVRELTGGGRSRAIQLTLGMSGLTRSRTGFGLYYTTLRSRDISTGVLTPGGGAPTTAGDPSAPEWGRSDLEVRHQLQLSLSHPVGRAFTLRAFGRLTSGSPFTPLVSGDVNGDGLSNDRAFVFDPARTRDTVFARAMSALLYGAPGYARDCLRRQLGRVAERNACDTPWSPSLDLRLTGQLDRMGSRWPMTIAVLASNVTSGLDYLLHGPDGLRGWGQLPLPDRTLLTVRGFDPALPAYRYAVNPQFGRLASTRGLTRSLFALTLQARLTLGADPSVLPLAGMMSAASAARSSAEMARRSLAERIVNVPERVLAADGPARLELRPAQVIRLQQAADSLAPMVAQVIETLTRIVIAPDSVRRTAEHGSRLADGLSEAKSVVDTGSAIVRAALTETQWARLPATLREPMKEETIVPSQRFQTSAGTP